MAVILAVFLGIGYGYKNLEVIKGHIQSIIGKVKGLTNKSNKKSKDIPMKGTSLVDEEDEELVIGTAAKTSGK